MAVADEKITQSLTTGDYYESYSSTTIIIGAGPVGYRCAMELSALCADMDVVLYGEEPFEPYNRIKLSSLLAGEIKPKEIFTPIPQEGKSARVKYRNKRINKIDCSRQTVVDEDQNVQHYDHLILATGSSARKIIMPGHQLEGVYTFRNLRDAKTLETRSKNSRDCVIVGGGLLGLEVARGMLAEQTRVTIVQHAGQLLERQLAPEAAAIFCNSIEKKGIAVERSTSIQKLLSEDNKKISAVETQCGKILPCDTLIICAGVEPNTQLAKDAGLEVKQGIVVSSALQTSEDKVFAVGECCEYENTLFGLVSPGLEQAAVLCNNLARGEQDVYRSAAPFAQLKLGEEYVACLGDMKSAIRQKGIEEISYKREGEGVCRTLLLKDARIIAACCVGPWDEIRSLREKFDEGIVLRSWQKTRFRFFGNIAFSKLNTAALQMQDTEIVCHCMHVSKRRIVTAIDGGASCCNSVSDKTGAGSVCGSCQPQVLSLLQGEIGGGFKLPDIAGKTMIVRVGVLAGLLGLLLAILPGLPTVSSVQSFQYDILWKDSLAKQISGFSLLGLCLFMLLISVRKRMGWKFLGDYDKLRMLHTVLGLGSVFVLLLHTGAHLGSNLNRLLMINFIGVIVVGALAGISLALANKYERGQSLKKVSYWAHLIVAWPLPALLAAHIVAVYYF